VTTRSVSLIDVKSHPRLGTPPFGVDKGYFCGCTCVTVTAAMQAMLPRSHGFLSDLLSRLFAGRRIDGHLLAHQDLSSIHPSGHPVLGPSSRPSERRGPQNDASCPHPLLEDQQTIRLQSSRKRPNAHTITIAAQPCIASPRRVERRLAWGSHNT
jgi:hypothetical protein